MRAILGLWDGEDIALVVLCLIAGVLALVFFASLLWAEVKEAKRRSDARKAFERAQKYFAVEQQPPSKDEKEVPN